MGSKVARVGTMLGMTVVLLLIPLRVSSWALGAGLGTAVVVTAALTYLLPLAARAEPHRLAVVVTVVVAVAPLAAAVILAVRDGSVGVLGILVIGVGGVLHRVVATIVERTVATGALPLVSGAVGTVGYAVTVCLAVVGRTTGSLPIAVAIAVAVGLGEGMIASRLLRDELPAG